MLVFTFYNASCVLVATMIGSLCASLVSASSKHPLSPNNSSLVRIIRRYFRAWLFLFKGPAIIQEEYDKAGGRTFEIFIPDNRYLFVTSPKHLEEINAAPERVLSLKAAAKDMLQPVYTMHGFNWIDGRATDGKPLLKTLQALTRNVPNAVPKIRAVVSSLFDAMHETHPVIDGTKQSPLLPMAMEAVAYANALAFFGDDLARDPSFRKVAVDFIENTLFMAEIIRFVPDVIKPALGKFLATRYDSHKILYDVLRTVTEERLEEKAQQRFGKEPVVHNDCIQWVMDSSPTQKPWTAERIVHELMAVWLGSVHLLSTSIAYTVHNISLHPEYVESLRAEIEGPEWTAFEESGRGLPLLDSFIKETSRTTPVESMSTRRQALEPFSLSDGSRIEVGELLCTPSRAMMRDAANFTDPLEFHGFRFVEPKILAALGSTTFRIPQPTQPSQFTDLAGWQIWGTGRMACPGRFHAAAVMKTILSVFITKYDCQLSAPDESRWFTWRSFSYPKASTTVILRPRPSST